jgi:hypothetical protein
MNDDDARTREKLLDAVNHLQDIVDGKEQTPVAFIVGVAIPCQHGDTDHYDSFTYVYGPSDALDDVIDAVRTEMKTKARPLSRAERRRLIRRRRGDGI